MVEYRLLFLPIGQVLKILWHFETLTQESMGNLKCGISQKRLVIERNGRKFGSRGITVHKYRVLLMPDSLSLVWGHSVHFAKFPIPQFAKHYLFNSFHQISTKLHKKCHIRGSCSLLLFWRSAKN